MVELCARSHIMGAASSFSMFLFDVFRLKEPFFLLRWICLRFSMVSNSGERFCTDLIQKEEEIDVFKKIINVDHTNSMGIFRYIVYDYKDSRSEYGLEYPLVTPSSSSRHFLLDWNYHMQTTPLVVIRRSWRW